MSVARASLMGLTYYDPSKAYDGYTLISPWTQNHAWLIDIEGRIVHSWSLPSPVMLSRLLPNGNLLCLGRGSKPRGGPDMAKILYRGRGGFKVQGAVGLLAELDWDGALVWKYDDCHINHDCWRLENGNTVTIAYERVPDEIKRQVRGGIPMKEPETPMWDDGLWEITPDGRIAWEWKAYEHLDPEVDIICPLELRSEWTHMNTCTILPDGNILGSFRSIDMICIIDRKTGDITWRWGPGEIKHQHEPTMLENGNILLFDNGCHRNAQEPFSRAVEVNPKTGKIEWEYKHDPPFEFYSSIQGGCQRLPNGNTLITEAMLGRVFEVTYEGEIVWEYVNPSYTDFEELDGHCNIIYRSYRYSRDYKGFKGRNLDPNNHQAINRIFGPGAFQKTRPFYFAGGRKTSVARTRLRGVTQNMPWQTYKGYTLFIPLGAKYAQLIDMQGRVAHRWNLPYPSALYGVLLDNGNLLCAIRAENLPLAEFQSAAGGLVEMGWDGHIVWQYEDNYMHHAFYRLPNGNTMIIRWIPIPKDVATKVKGGLPGTEKQGVIWGDCFEEVTPSGKVIWEWMSYEHLNPELDTICPLCSRDRWTEATSCVVLENEDILTSFRRTNTVYIVDRNTGDIKWRWGGADRLGHQNDVTVLENGNILLFDNGIHTNGNSLAYSQILEITPDTNEIIWEYRAPYPFLFFSSFMSSCQRLPNGNTLICEAQTGRIFEVTQKGELVWEYVNPFYADDPVFGHSNVVPRAYRYGVQYEGLRKRGNSNDA